MVMGVSGRRLGESVGMEEAGGRWCKRLVLEKCNGDGS